jgi:glycosyltransferase involved in cell wall biosynthesis
LRRCLLSIPTEVRQVVYVDSGSTDDSVEFARSRGADVVDLDMSIPFTAARARNAGWRRLLELTPGLEFVQFVDGDCRLAAGWITAGLAEITSDKGVAAVFGHRREEHPETSVYNLVCDIEWRWDLPLGDVTSFGGDALISVQALTSAGGYDDTLIAGEEPELCFRMRQQGWRIRHIDHPMTLHDAALTRFGQWWQRARRSGHAYAELGAMHGQTPEQYMVRQVRSIAAWTLGVPALSFGLALPTLGLSLGLLGGYGVLFDRIRRSQVDKGVEPRDATLYAFYCVLGKFPQMVGITNYWLNRASGRRSKIIEYKKA